MEKEAHVLGRFGWKASQPTIRQQIASAFHEDIGATTYIFPEENCPESQVACRALPSAAKCGGQGGCTGHTYRPEVVPSRLTNIAFYLQALMVPTRLKSNDPETQRGEKLFLASGCDACHTPSLVTGPANGSASLGNITIRAYTDLLLHDMGPKLADHMAVFSATGSEWRTPPLWGLGRLPAVGEDFALLHDGRARTLTEAIAWHGGEAESAREHFRAMSEKARRALIAFLGSL